MYPNVPFEGLSWPFTQHAGVVTEGVIKLLLESAARFDGEQADTSAINKEILKSGKLSANFRSDSQQVDAWRDYQQILSELGLIYSTRFTNGIIHLTPVAKAYLEGSMSFAELLTLQVLKYQYPNAQKWQIADSLRETLPDSLASCRSFVELESRCGILIRPGALILQALILLNQVKEKAFLTQTEISTFFVRCTSMADLNSAIKALLVYRKTGKTELQPLNRSRRNVADWMKIMSLTPLVVLKQASKSRDWVLYLSDYALNNSDDLENMYSQLCKDTSFWKPELDPNKSSSWFAFYGSINVEIDLIPQEGELSEDEIQERAARRKKVGIEEDNEDEELASSVCPVKLNAFSSISAVKASKNGVVSSTYAFEKTRRQTNLHNAMINKMALVASKKGASVFQDPNTVDLDIRSGNNEFMFEVKSITPRNFIARLRTAIGQINQYDFLLEKPDGAVRKLCLAFTASIPNDSWAIPFITEFLGMALVTYEGDNLVVRGDPQLKELLSKEE